MMYNAGYWIDKLELSKHPEGGYFREVYRSGEIISKKGLPGRYTSFRSFSTSIYFLLESDEFSAFHRLKSDETWHFYAGSALAIYIIDPRGKLGHVLLGSDAGKGQVFQFTVPKGHWFASAVNESRSYSLLGCTVAPGFDFEDFEMGIKSKLIKRFPQHQRLIDQMCLV